MSPKDYRPQPIDTSRVEVPEEVMNLMEMLARNTHEIWSQHRLQAGWHWGEERDDARKLHPCLVPYDELPESEKVYDRAIAIELVKAILGLGFRIVPPGRKAQ